MPSMKLAVSTKSEGPTSHHRTPTAEFWSTEHRMGGPADQPNPLQLLLASLTGCMSVVLQMVAQDKGWSEVRAEFAAEGEMDPRGFMGDPSVAPYFHTVELEVRLYGVPQDSLDTVKQEVGRRCPVHRLMEQAGVTIRESWVIQ